MENEKYREAGERGKNLASNSNHAASFTTELARRWKQKT